MAAGKPIVCSDIEGYRAVVPAGGARLVRPGDAAGLADALGELLPSAELRRKLGEVNRAASLIYDWSRLAGRVREEYLLARESRGSVIRPRRSAGRAGHSTATATASA
jgi:glycosyltransferase involved in cell wall biosynthesis